MAGVVFANSLGTFLLFTATKHILSACQDASFHCNNQLILHFRLRTPLSELLLTCQHILTASCEHTRTHTARLYAGFFSKLTSMFLNLNSVISRLI